MRAGLGPLAVLMRGITQRLMQDLYVFSARVFAYPADVRRRPLFEDWDLRVPEFVDRQKKGCNWRSTVAARIANAKDLGAAFSLTAILCTCRSTASTVLLVVWSVTRSCCASVQLFGGRVAFVTNYQHKNYIQ